MALVERIQQKSFLGTEFATWLWYQSESNRGSINMGGDKTCQLDFENDLVLTSDYGEATASTLRGDAPTLSPEAATALEAGKKVKRAKVRLAQNNVTWIFTLNAENFDWGSLKIEMPPSLPFDEAVPLRLRALEEFHQVFEALFSRFLDIRLMPEVWKNEEEQMRHWVAGKLLAEKGEAEEA